MFIQSTVGMSCKQRSILIKCHQILVSGGLTSQERQVLGSLLLDTDGPKVGKTADGEITSLPGNREGMPLAPSTVGVAEECESAP